MIETGKVLQQRYRIDKQIGQGGMGAVYIATDERFGSTVAIKETLLMDDNYRKAIEREARLLNSLKHAALPRVSDHFLEENGQFLVMEYIPGEDLAHMIESGVVFDVGRVLKWADQLLDALEFLHNQSMPVIHRDIKPQNLKLTARDQIILLDFGLAKGNPTDAGHQTAAKSIFGYSRNYASVEQIQGTGTDPRSDLYSLAATLYHLLTGTPPEDALTRAMAVLSSRPDPLVPANSIRPEVPVGVAGVLQIALALNADDRPSSAAEMREMLREPERFSSRIAGAPTFVGTTAADLSAQQTKLMGSDATRHELVGHTDVKTAVHPGYVSTETALRPAANTGKVGGKKGGRRFALTATALVALLVACSGAAGVYFFYPSLLDAGKAVPVVTEPRAQQQPPEPQPSMPDAGDVPANADPEKAAASEPPLGSDSPSAAKPSAAPAPAKTDRAAKQPANDSTNVDMGDVHIEGDNVYMGNTRIGPDGITPNIDPNRIRVPRVYIPPLKNGEVFPGVTREQFNRMSPDQQRKLLEARRRLIMMRRSNQQQPPQPPYQP